MFMFKLHPQLSLECITLCDLKLCRVLLANDRQYPWFILVPMQNGIKEIIDLSEADQPLLWQESAKLSRVIQAIYGPDKLNVAALGNMVPQLHVHHVARFITDPAWPSPIWGKLPLVPYDESQIEVIKHELIATLTKPGF
ncbi:MAG: diadenosine tetraphosphate (Ap4A) HIT family hydrolase [Alteromonadaceae bacterium]|jgi:diadenosine tetraphosphate (Ap4A) HIT family hydrolase